MKVLVACEFSGVVRDAFRKRGHDAWSCDILPCDKGGDFHFQCDVVEVLDMQWDMIIAHPPCTYLTNAGTRHYSRRINSEAKVVARELERLKAFEFFMLFTKTSCSKVAVENPVGWVNTHWRKPDQIIHPYYFGDSVKKRTCLWLEGLPKLEATNLLPTPSRCISAKVS